MYGLKNENKSNEVQKKEKALQDKINLTTLLIKMTVAKAMKDKKVLEKLKMKEIKIPNYLN